MESENMQVLSFQNIVATISLLDSFFPYVSNRQFAHYKSSSRGLLNRLVVRVEFGRVFIYTLNVPKEAF